MILKLAERIQYLRERYGLSQSDLGKKLDVTRSSVNAWENYGAVPSVEKVVKMTEIFHVTSDYIIGLDESLKVDISNLTPEEQEAILKIVKCISEK